MLSTVEKVKQLENYLISSNMPADPFIEHTINKLLIREYERMASVKNRLATEITQFETQYAMNSNSFYHRYEAGELGDEMDFIEWSATLEMLKTIEKQLQWLEITFDK